MKAYSIDDIVNDVRTAMDYNSSDNNLSAFSDVDTISLDEIIKSKIVEGVKIIHSTAPIYLLEGGCNFRNAIYWGEHECGHILLPDDFMRLITFRMSDWARGVYNAITPDDPEYKKQSSRFKGIRGNYQKPVCAVVFRSEGKALEFYSCKSRNAHVSNALYLPYPTIKNDMIEICEKCYQSIIYTVAALTAAALRDTDNYNIFNQLSKNALI